MRHAISVRIGENLQSRVVEREPGERLRPRLIDDVRVQGWMERGDGVPEATREPVAVPGRTGAAEGRAAGGQDEPFVRPIRGAVREGNAEAVVGSREADHDAAQANVDARGGEDPLEGGNHVAAV